MKGELLKGHLDFLLLATVESEPAHGYLIIEQLRKRSGGAFDLPEGTIYPALHRLERAGFLASHWAKSDSHDRLRRVYRLTLRGRLALSTHRQKWTQFSEAVTAILEPTP